MSKKIYSQQLNEDIKQSEQTDLFIPYSKINEAKKYKCFFNPNTKLWSIKKTNPNYQEAIKLYAIQNLINIYENKEEYKNNEAKWNNESKIWQTYKSNEKLLEYFEPKIKQPKRNEEII